MKATVWHGKHDVRVENVPDPTIQDPRDAILRITSTAICGSDLHLYDGFIPTMDKGDILGHEFMGVVEEVGKANGLKKGDRVVIPFQIACGQCHFCRRMETALCDTTNPEGAAKMQKALSPAKQIGPPSIQAVTAPAATARTVLTTTTRSPWKIKRRSRIHKPKLTARGRSRSGGISNGSCERSERRADSRARRSRSCAVEPIGTLSSSKAFYVPAGLLNSAIRSAPAPARLSSQFADPVGTS